MTESTWKKSIAKKFPSVMFRPRPGGVIVAIAAGKEVARYKIRPT